MPYHIFFYTEKLLLTHDLHSLHTMSTNQENPTNAHEQLFNDLHKIKELKAEHKKKKAALLEEIQTTKNRCKKYKSKCQKDVRRSKRELAKHRSKSRHSSLCISSFDEGPVLHYTLDQENGSIHMKADSRHSRS